ncbi:hypothetical protein L1987_02353 [Smallanthus sonchifolius]|uniref:Uncharacterized protein n=1 Tax=Smallanthus sonchifolius TaxID=185202 RepID=A0ACB9K7I5_9ASTR|nr:hypothetical protein L1987_02353 [Smallanthus sonchifolius]
MKSHLLGKGVDLNGGVTKEDEQVWEFICNDEDILYQLHGDLSRKKAIETILKERGKGKCEEFGKDVISNPRARLLGVLNYEDRFRSNFSQHRLFVNTKAIFPWMLNDENTEKEKRLEHFIKNMKAAVKGDDKLVDLKAFDMVLFPVLEFNHYYILKELFVDYLEEKKHPKTDEIAGSNIHKVKLEWATTNNYTDCGVFLMRHMERLMGLHEMFECGFSKNGRKKLTELKRLRKKMVAHILLSPANVLREKVVDEALKKGKVVAPVQYF